MPNLDPITRKEHFMSRAAGGPGLELEPVTREEHFLQAIVESGGGGGGGGGGDVTPASIVTATGDMTSAQKLTTLYNLGAASDADLSVLGGEVEDLKTTAISVSGTTPTITPLNNTIYNCGTLASLTITAPLVSGAYGIVFTSGANPTVTTLPEEPILGLENFAAEANTLYEINVLDNRAVVGSWVVSGA